MDIYTLLDYDSWATAHLFEAVGSLSPEPFVQEPVLTATPESFATPQELLAYEAQVRQRLDNFLQGLNRAELGRIHEYVTQRGVLRASVEQTLLQVVHHGTYHRGQVACLLKLHGIDFPDTDYLLWINQTQNA